eukprot:scaffold11140_cov19-Tisochrysis_lutea.AAC.1
MLVLLVLIAAVPKIRGTFWSDRPFQRGGIGACAVSNQCMCIVMQEHVRCQTSVCAVRCRSMCAVKPVYVQCDAGACAVQYRSFCSVMPEHVQCDAGA